MKFARYTFLTAGVLGMLILLPQYFLLEKTSADYPPAITHPEYYYGFTGVAFSFQIVFLIIAGDPARFRPMMLVSVVEKFSFGLAVLILFSQGRVPAPMMAAGGFDLTLGVLFIISYIVTARTSRRN
jgi:hypothetical protein